jgi:hypothetical protein
LDKVLEGPLHLVLRDVVVLTDTLYYLGELLDGFVDVVSAGLCGFPDATNFGVATTLAGLSTAMRRIRVGARNLEPRTSLALRSSHS